jgi:RHS repeat-associated protein
LKICGCRQFCDAETGLDYFGARYFSVAQGRFTTPDPNSAGASLFDPQSWNAYSYMNNRPLAYVDPDGDIPLPVITGLGGGIIGGGVSAYAEYKAQQRLAPGERQPNKIWTAFGGGFVGGALAGATLGGLAAGGVVLGPGTTASVEAVSSAIGGYAQRRTNEALGYDAAPESEGLEVASDPLSGGLGGALGGALGEKLVPLPNIRLELKMLSFAHRRSTRAARKAAAQSQFDGRAIVNTAFGEGSENVVFTPIVRSAFDWLFRTPQPKVESKSRYCSEGEQAGCP